MIEPRFPLAPVTLDGQTFFVEDIPGDHVGAYDDGTPAFSVAKTQVWQRLPAGRLGLVPSVALKWQVLDAREPVEITAQPIESPKALARSAERLLDVLLDGIVEGWVTVEEDGTFVVERTQAEIGAHAAFSRNAKPKDAVHYAFKQLTNSGLKILRSVAFASPGNAPPDKWRFRRRKTDPVRFTSA